MSTYIFTNKTIKPSKELMNAPAQPYDFSFSVFMCHPAKHKRRDDIKTVETPPPPPPPRNKA